MEIITLEKWHRENKKYALLSAYCSFYMIFIDFEISRFKTKNSILI